MKYVQVMISAEQRVQAMALMDALLERRLILGGPIFNGPAKFLWKDEIVESDYCYISTMTREDLRDELIAVAEATSVEEVCMISFLPFHANPALIKLLDASFEGRETKAAPLPKAARAALMFVENADISSRTTSSF